MSIPLPVKRYRYECEVCKEQFPLLYEYQEHFELAHADKIVPEICTRCGTAAEKFDLPLFEIFIELGDSGEEGWEWFQSFICDQCMYSVRDDINSFIHGKLNIDHSREFGSFDFHEDWNAKKPRGN